MNNRTDTHSVLQETYRIAIKTIADSTLVRLDFPADEALGIAARSMLSDGKEMIVFDSKTETVQHRFVLDDDSAAGLDFFQRETTVSRINLKRIKTGTARLAFGLEENTESGLLVLKLPPDLLPADEHNRLVSSRISFDMHNETLHEAETIHIQGDGSTVTTNTVIRDGRQ